MHDFDCVIAGAGVVGLAIARAVALSGREVLVVEKAGTIGTVTSSRNSEVIHAGIYYAPGSLKARLCAEGRERLYAYCREHNIAHDRTGKLIVAVEPDQLDRLSAIRANAQSCGVGDLDLLTQAQAESVEPALRCAGALQPAYAGVRPKLSGPGQPAADFTIQGPADHGAGRIVNLFGIESPGLTASLAIAEHVVELLYPG